jgi:hypothetical protein
MSSHLRCPSCQVPLKIPDTVRLEWITCPRCLAAVRHPLMASQTQGAPCRRCGRVNLGARKQCVYCAAMTPRASGDQLVVCTVCAEVVPGHAAHCPLAPVTGASTPWQDRPADSEARSDSDLTFVPAAALVLMLIMAAFATVGPVGGAVALFFLGTSLFTSKGPVLSGVLRTLFYMGLFIGILFMLGFIALWITCAMR